jgi:hypothetical protein
VLVGEPAPPPPLPPAPIPAVAPMVTHYTSHTDYVLSHIVVVSLVTWTCNDSVMVDTVPCHSPHTHTSNWIQPLINARTCTSMYTDRLYRRH